jgi:hypothetical protein
VAQSQVFTPQANAITALAVQLPVRADIIPDENHIYAFDLLGLSILQAGVPIPAFDTGNHTPSGPNDLIDFPASQAGASIAPANAFGYTLLLSADWVPSGTVPPEEPPGGPPTTSGPPLRFATPMALVRANNAIIDLTCTLARPCPRDIVLQNRPAPGAAILNAAADRRARAKRTKTYARASFNLPAGQTQMISVPLNAKGRKLARSHRTAQVWANVTLAGSEPAQVVSGELTLRR